MCSERGVDLVVKDVVEGSVVGETSLVPEIEAEADIFVFNTTPMVCVGDPD